MDIEHFRGNRKENMGMPEPEFDLEIALGVVVWEARVLCEALLLSAEDPNRRPPRHRFGRFRIANETAFMKSRSLLMFLYPGKKLDARDFHATDFPGEVRSSRSPEIEAFFRQASERCAHLTRDRVRSRLPSTQEKTGRSMEEWCKLILDHTIAFITRQRMAGLQLKKGKHEQDWRALVSAYQSLYGERLLPVEGAAQLKATGAVEEAKGTAWRGGERSQPPD